jgi:hypothetical protein
MRRRAVQPDGESPARREVRAGFAPVEHDAELGRHERLVPTAPEGLADERLVVAVAVGVGRVEHRHAGVERPVDRLDRARLAFAGAVVAFEPHGAVADPADGRAQAAER